MREELPDVNIAQEFYRKYEPKEVLEGENLRGNWKDSLNNCINQVHQRRSVGGAVGCICPRAPRYRSAKMGRAKISQQG